MTVHKNAQGFNLLLSWEQVQACLSLRVPYIHGWISEVCAAVAFEQITKTFSHLDLFPGSILQKNNNK